MTKWECLQICVYISNETTTPLEILWWDNQLTLIGAFAVISLEVGIINKIINKKRKI